MRRKTRTGTESGFHSPRHWSLLGGLLILLCVLYLYGPLLMGRAFLWFDAVDHAIIRLETICTTFAKGRVPLWDPTTHGGQLLIGDPAYGIFYPFHLLAALATWAKGTYSFAFINWLVVLETLFCAAGMFLLSRRVLKFSALAALVSTCIFVFSTPVVCRVLQYIHYTQVVLIPWILLGVMGVRNGGRRYVIGMSVLWAMMFLGANPQYMYHCSLAAALFAVIDIVSFTAQERSFRKSIRLSFKYLFIVACGFGLSAYALLPIHDYIQHGSRSVGNMALGTGTPLAQFVTYLVPYWFGKVAGQGAPYFGREGFWNYWEYSQYVGIMALVLTLLAVLHASKNRFWWYLISLVLCGWVYAYGVNNPLPSFLPLGKTMRIPGKFLVYVAFGLALLAGMGVQLIEDGRLTRGFAKRFSIVGFCVSIAVFSGTLVARLIDSKLFLAQAAQTKLVFSGLVVLSALLALSFGVLWLYSKGTLPSFWIAALCAVVVVVDLIPHNRGFNLGSRDPRKYYASSPGIEALRNEMRREPFRISGGPFTFNNLRGTHFGLHTMEGYTANVAHWYYMLRSGQGSREPRKRERYHDLFNVKYEFVPDRGSVRLLPRKNCSPRVFSVRQIEIVDESNIVDRLYSPEFDIHTTMLVTPEFRALSNLPPPSVPDAVGIMKYQPTRIEVRATLDTPAYVVLSENKYPGWSVTIDGKPGQVIDADYSLRAVLVPEGTHRIVWRFRSKPFERGLMIAAATAIVLCVYAVFPRRKLPMSRGTPAS